MIKSSYAVLISFPSLGLSELFLSVGGPDYENTSPLVQLPLYSVIPNVNLLKQSRRIYVAAQIRI